MTDRTPPTTDTEPATEALDALLAILPTSDSPLPDAKTVREWVPRVAEAADEVREALMAEAAERASGGTPPTTDNERGKWLCENDAITYFGPGCPICGQDGVALPNAPSGRTPVTPPTTDNEPATVREALETWLFPRGLQHPGTWALTNEGAREIARAALAAERASGGLDCRDGHDYRLTTDFDGEPVRCVRCKATPERASGGLDVEALIADMPVAVLATDGGPAVAYAMRVEAYLRSRLATPQPGEPA